MRSQKSENRSQKSATARNFAFLTLFALPSFWVCPAQAVFTADLSNGEIVLKLEAIPDIVDPAQDLMLTLTVEAPAKLTVTLPDLRDRFSGFTMAEDFAEAPFEVQGRIRQTQRWRLTPEPAAVRYRLAPFAVQIEDARTLPTVREAFVTKPVLFPIQGERSVVTGDPEVTPTPEWIYPTAKTVVLWVVVALSGIAILVLIFFGLSRLSRRVREHRMSPKERAMAELQRLLSRNLPGRGFYKEFYIELTAVVRRYIERAYGIRAPEQTTEEFLVAAALQPCFTLQVLTELRTFLESADLVKFAGQEANAIMTNEATANARTYIETDASEGNLEHTKVKSKHV